MQLSTPAKLVASLGKHILKRPKFTHASVRREENKREIQPCEYQGQRRRRRRRRCPRHQSRDSLTACGRDHRGTDIPLQPMERTMLEQISRLQPMKDVVLVHVYHKGLQPVERTHREMVWGRNSKKELLWIGPITPYFSSLCTTLGGGGEDVEKLGLKQWSWAWEKKGVGCALIFVFFSHHPTWFSFAIN